MTLTIDAARAEELNSEVSEIDHPAASSGCLAAAEEDACMYAYVCMYVCVVLCCVHVGSCCCVKNATAGV